MEPLSKRELIRYSRHFNLAEVGLAGQRKLKAAAVLLIGAGGLGSPLALYLAAAGVGRIGIVDFDVVDETNLQRQVLHGTADVGRSKLESAAKRLSDLNPHVRFDFHETRLSSQNALDLFSTYDVVADGADNFPTRYLVNDACVLSGIPLVSGSIQGFEGQLAVFNYKGGPCYRCLFPEPPPPGTVPSCAEGGVLGILPGVVGTLQATEVIKIILNVGDIAAGRLVLYNALELSFTSLTIERDEHCVLCGKNPNIKELIDYEAFCGFNQAEQGRDISEIEAIALRQQLAELVLLDVREAYEREICHIEPSLHHPLADLAAMPDNVPKNAPLVIYCRTGVRSRKAARELMAMGYRNVKSLAGGIHAWIDHIEPGLEKY